MPQKKKKKRLIIQSEVNDIRDHQRIFIRDGATLLGVMDEYGVLENDQIFVKIETPNTKTGGQVITGDVLVTKCPCLAPGDLRRFKAVNHFQLQHLCNVVVFSQKGAIPPPMVYFWWTNIFNFFYVFEKTMSGSDLDGDVYQVIYEKRLLEAVVEENAKPLLLGRPKVETVEEVTIADLKKLFLNYLSNDCLGVVAHSHLAYASLLPEGANAPQCLALAALHSLAVDFRKTTVPVNLSSAKRQFQKRFGTPLILDAYPLFMQKRNKQGIYTHKALDKIYQIFKDNNSRAFLDEMSEKMKRLNDVKATWTWVESTLPRDFVETVDIDRSLRKYQKDAERVFREYKKDIASIKTRYEVNTEIEIFLHKPLFCSFVHENKARKIATKMVKESREITKKYRAEFFRCFCLQAHPTVKEIYDNFFPKCFQIQSEMRYKALAWYYVTMQHICSSKDNPNNDVILGFPFVVYDVFCSLFD
ncbi:RNA-directed RNA polymerase Rdp1 [Reticulomyxa filosa]|uniref:RNA-dependent RNA polymerase n=1 Tax=Reticulomyxa filosa TaxID=46433 RepID=X6LW44_RETFI|nr:RNA-directed RNA polymerase Rdp1 [Reticulomyxa filosa]|eukprot:ETO06173.1 RNA-directed RNA polymerase Rdp1 [Reticulomyxa filosa]